MCFFFTHTLIPIGLNSIEIAGFTLTSHGFFDVRSFIYYFNVKFLIISLLSIWFLSTIHWWRYAILSGIILNTHQLWEGFQEDLLLIDEVEYFYSLPYIAVLIAVLVIVSKSIKYYSKIIYLYEGICLEIEQIISHSNMLATELKVQTKEFNKLKRIIEKRGVTTKRLEDLKKLREELIREINAGG